MPRAPRRSQERAPDPATELAPTLPDLSGWVAHVLSADGFVVARHHRLLLSRLDAVAAGDIDRLLVLMPPGTAKSTYCSVLFPVWWLARHRGTSIITACHTADLAKHFARRARGLIDAQGAMLGYGLADGDRAAGRWATTTGGQFYATGVRGAITGRRADLAIIDDPVRTLADSESLRQRDHLWDWYRSDLMTRLKPRGRVVIVMARCHPDDLAGRLLEHGANDWSILRLPALAEADDPLGRQPGEALWPEWEDERALLHKRGQVGEHVWRALFQQTPQQAQGKIFKVAHIGELATPPDTNGGTIVRAWDLAATAETGANDPDYTVGLKLLREAGGRFVVLDIVRLRTSALAVEHILQETARNDGRSVPIGLPQDPGQAGRFQVSTYIRKLAGYVVRSSRETGPKVGRALPVSAQVEAGNLTMVRAAWNRGFIEELRDFPFGRKDDQVDALAYAFALLMEPDAAARRITIPFLAR